MRSSTMSFRPRPGMGFAAWTLSSNVIEGAAPLATATHMAADYSYVFPIAMVDPSNPYEIPQEVLDQTPNLF